MRTMLQAEVFQSLQYFFLEMFKYLSFIMSQSMIVFGPIVTIFVNEKNIIILQRYYQIGIIWNFSFLRLKKTGKVKSDNFKFYR